MHLACRQGPAEDPGKKRPHVICHWCPHAATTVDKGIDLSIEDQLLFRFCGRLAMASSHVSRRAIREFVALRPTSTPTLPRKALSSSRCTPSRCLYTPSNRTLPIRTPSYLTNSLTKRLISTKPLPSTRGPFFRFCYRTFAYAGFFVLASGGIILAFFAYDASTYRDDLTTTDIPVSVSALNPKRGGPKNLPIAEVLVDDDDCEENERQKSKPKLVVLGSGWGSVGLIKNLNVEDYHVTVVSPVNYFLFTPMLPSATVGTLELRSLVEPVRKIVGRVRGHFLKAMAEDVEFGERLLEVSQVDSKGVKRNFYLPYDKLVIGVGM